MPREPDERWQITEAQMATLGIVVVQAVVIDSNTRGLVATVTQPFFDGQALTTFVGAPAGQPVTQTTYDGLGQVKTVTEPTNRVTTHTYAAGIFQVIDPLGRAVNRKTDGLGRLTEVWEYTGTGTPSNPYQLYRQTSYRYTALDLLGNVNSLADWKAGSPQVQRQCQCQRGDGWDLQ